MVLESKTDDPILPDSPMDGPVVPEPPAAHPVVPASCDLKLSVILL